MLKRIATPTSRIFEFPTWREFIDYTRPYAHLVPTWSDFSHAGASDRDADKLADYGWPEGAEIARKFCADHVAILGSLIERHDVQYDVEGTMIDIARFNDNEPECWARFEPVLVEPQSPRFLRLVVNIGASGSVSARTILARGGALCALVDLLEMQNTRCEIAVVDATGDPGGGYWYCMTTIVKQFDQPLDMAQVAYAIGHPSVLRIHTFRLYERMGKEDSNQWRAIGYGAPADVPSAQRGDLYLGRMYGGDDQWLNPERAQAWILDHLKALGVQMTAPSPA